MKRVIVLLSLVALFAAACNDNQLGFDQRKKKLPPETILSGGPPDSTSGTLYTVELFWSGSDPDGTIDHYDFIMIDHPPIKNSIDGSAPPEETVVVEVPAVDDPRWVATLSTDSTFVTIADTLRTDPESGDPADIRNTPFERWHTFFVRAVDNEGVPDPDPDYRSFNSTNLAPTIQLKDPIQPATLFTAPPVIVFNWDGEDPITANTTQEPVASRWVLIESAREGSNRHRSFPDSLYHLPERYEWSPWARWNAADQSGVRAVVRGLIQDGDIPERTNEGYYIFAVQALDEAGAITPVFDEVTSNKNNAVKIRISGDVGPVLAVEDEFLGQFTFVGGSRPQQLDIAAGQPLRFRWSADASSYGGEITGYRYGWDILNPANDQEWTSFALSNRSAPTRTFASGSHTFSLQVIDNAESITSARFTLVTNQVTRRKDLLWVDDTWENLGQEGQEDARWYNVLEQLASENNFEFIVDRDVYDARSKAQKPPPIDLVFDYKVIIWSVRSFQQGSALKSLAKFFDPFFPDNRNAVKSFNFLNIYLKNQGKIWINGEQTPGQMWEDFANQNAPINVTNWDDPVNPQHPLVDSVGVSSTLYNMCVEVFDCGAATGCRRSAAPHWCKGLERATPVGSQIQSFVTESAEAHRHNLDIPTTDVDGATMAVTYETQSQQDHEHMVTLTLDDFMNLRRGDFVFVETTVAGSPQHSHLVGIRDQVGLWGAPVLTVSESWGIGALGRPNIWILNMPSELILEGLFPDPEICTPVYTYVSGVREDFSTTPVVTYPTTADKQPVFLLAKGSSFDEFYSRAFCTFEPSLLDPLSHKRLTEFIVVRHFRLGRSAN